MKTGFELDAQTGVYKPILTVFNGGKRKVKKTRRSKKTRKGKTRRHR